MSTQKTKKPLLTQERLKNLFYYDSFLGALIRKRAKATQRAGSIAGCLMPQGYLVTRVDNILYFNHRLVWLYVNGYFPENDIDHINKNPSDNRICNLREVSRSCNLRNAKQSCTNRSGVKGIHWDKQKNSWIVNIRHKDKNICVGGFKNFFNAVKARYHAEQKCNYVSCDSNSPAKEYLENRRLFPVEFETNINIDKNKMDKKDKEKIESEWLFFSFTGKKRFDTLIDKLECKSDSPIS